MARYEPTVVQLDKKSMDAINNLTKAINKQNELGRKAARAVRLTEPSLGEDNYLEGQGC